MQVSRISLAPYRPRVTRVGPSQEIHKNNNNGSLSKSSINSWQNKVSSENEDSLKKATRQSSRQAEKRFCRRMWCIFGSLIIIALLLGAFIGLLLAFELPYTTISTTTTTTGTSTTTTTATTSTGTTSTTISTTTSSSTSSTTSTSSTSSTSTISSTSSTSSTTTASTTSSTTSTSSTSSTSTTSSTASTSTTSATTTTSQTTSTTTATTTTTAPSCTPGSPSTIGQIFSFNSGSAPTIYTLSTYGFIANDSSATLTFVIRGEQMGQHKYWLLDDVSVNYTNASTNVLVNGGFETGNLTGWTQYCATSGNCGGGTRYGLLTTSACRSGTYCYVDQCEKYDFLMQSFSTVSGGYYLISFYLELYASGAPDRFVYVLLN